MFKKSKVSRKGRWIITAIFILAVLGPELLTVIVLAPKVAYPRVIIGRSLIRLIWCAPLYYFTMLGHTWARGLTVLSLMASSALLITFLRTQELVWMCPTLIVFIASVVILIGVKEVRPDEHRKFDRY